MLPWIRGGGKAKHAGYPRYILSQTVAAVTYRVHAAYLHAHDGHSEVGSSQVNSQSALRFQDVIDVLREGVLHRGETESLLEGLVQVDGT